MKEFVARIDAWIRRHLITVNTIATILAIVFLPLVPFTPACRDEQRHWVNLGAVVLAPAYREHVTHYFRRFDVPYLAVGGIILIPSWIWVSGGPDDELINASNKPIHSLLREGWNDRPGLPEHVRVLMARSRAAYDGRLEQTCELVRAVAIDGW